MNKFKKENNEDGLEDKSGICIGKINFVMIFSYVLIFVNNIYLVWILNVLHIY